MWAKRPGLRRRCEKSAEERTLAPAGDPQQGWPPIRSPVGFARFVKKMGYVDKHEFSKADKKKKNV